ncbi:TetR family transcriptional regulator [Caballeronia hypogeia]|uniref:TetR family transcriptional regulator n=1 Tax=Caballeronia hypogeia TaxID=1777140 RepID=A0A157ZGA2_9BURK|nr:TetR family transcriptional regulator [Caballeronia hypogeia]SAK44516.1 TetR family transcriptional regulator [Caballeronia hypogeia]
MQDRRQTILEAALATLREEGYSGFTQPRVAARAGVRQSHLTYYFPTRLALIEAVARTAIDAQLAAIDEFVGEASLKTNAGAIANVVVRHENTRVLMALAQAADEEPTIRTLFRELADGVAERITRMLEAMGLAVSKEHVSMVHALAVGLAVIDLAVGRADGKRRASTALETLFTLLPPRA